jgi:hypothetical protein
MITQYWQLEMLNPKNAQNLQTYPALAQTHSCLTHFLSFDLKGHFTPPHSTHSKKHETVNKLQCKNCEARITHFWQLETRCSNAHAPLQNTQNIHIFPVLALIPVPA